MEGCSRVKIKYIVHEKPSDKMDKTEFLESIITKMGGSFVEKAPNHFVISHIPHKANKVMKKLIARLGGGCMIEYRPDKEVVEAVPDGA